VGRWSRRQFQRQACIASWYRYCPSLEGEPKARRSAPEVASQSLSTLSKWLISVSPLPETMRVPSREQATEKNDPATSPMEATDDRTRRNVPEVHRSLKATRKDVGAIETKCDRAYICMRVGSLQTARWVAGLEDWFSRNAVGLYDRPAPRFFGLPIRASAADVGPAVVFTQL